MRRHTFFTYKGVSLLSTFVLLALLVTHCTTTEPKLQDPFEITPGRIGHLTSKTRVYELDSIFAQDSIVKRVAGDEFINHNNEIEIFEKGGKKLLVLAAKEDFDTTSTIESVQILDARFKTKDSLSLKSTYGEFQKRYKVSKVSNLLSTALVFIDSLQIYFTLDKKHLPASLQNTDTKIETSQIPDDSKVKDLWVGWD